MIADVIGRLMRLVLRRQPPRKMPGVTLTITASDGSSTKLVLPLPKVCSRLTAKVGSITPPSASRPSLNVKLPTGLVAANYVISHPTSSKPSLTQH